MDDIDFTRYADDKIPYTIGNDAKFVKNVNGLWIKK